MILKVLKIISLIFFQDWWEEFKSKDMSTANQIGSLTNSFNFLGHTSVKPDDVKHCFTPAYDTMESIVTAEIFALVCTLLGTKDLKETCNIEASVAHFEEVVNAVFNFIWKVRLHIQFHTKFSYC